MTTTVYFNGRTTAIPGSYSEVDVSGLAVVGLGATGIVALLGEVEGGSPYNGSTPIHKISNPGKVGRTFREGDLVEAGNIVFDPSKDPDIPAGAQQVYFVKVNPATQSSYTFKASTTDQLTLTSVDYGLFTTQINVEIATGTTQGKAITIVLNDLTESWDDVGGTAVFTALYTPGSLGADTMVMALDNGAGVTALFTKSEAGLDSELTTPAPGAEKVQIESTDAGDTTQTVTIYGTDGSGAAQTEVLSLNGTTVVVGTATWTDVLGAEVSAAHAGTVTVKSNPTTATTILAITTGNLTAGLALVDNVDVSGTALSVVADAADTSKVGLFGLNNAAAVGEVLTLNGTTPVVGTQVFTELTVIAVGETPAARTVTVSGEVFDLTTTAYPTVSEIATRINALGGWTLTVSANAGTIQIANMDDSAVSTVIGSAKSFYGNLAYIVDKINAESSLVTAAAATGFTGVPDNTTAPTFLTGGVEGATAFADWQAALDLLRDEYVSTIVPLTDDEAIHAAVVSHCVYMAGAGRKERDAIFGEDSGTTFTQGKTAAVALNTRHARLCIQDVERFNTAGVREQFPPYFTACLAAGMQAGSEVGTSLTAKYANVLDVIGDDTTYTIQDDADELIQSGLLMLEPVSNVGWRWLRNVTTYLIDDNVAYTEASVNEATNYAVYNLRTQLEAAVGKKGFAGTVNATLSIAVDILNRMVDETIITTWRNLTITLDGDVMEVDVELAPVQPINFVLTTVHLVSASFAAAA